MIPIEETDLYKRVKDQVQVKINLDDPNRLSDLRIDIAFRYLQAFPMDDLNEPTLMENHTKILAENAFYDILEQCGITRKDYQFLIFCKKFTGKDRYDYISAYRGCRMGSCDSRNEEPSRVVGEE